MYIDFTGESLPKIHFILYINRHKVIGGWYVRIIMTNRGFKPGGQNECATFLSDPEHSWQTDDFIWEKIKIESEGGVYRGKAFGGWLLFSTAIGQAKTDDGILYRPRMGTLVFISDPEFSWECEIQKEK